MGMKLLAHCLKTIIGFYPNGAVPETESLKYNGFKTKTCRNVEAKLNSF